MKKVLVAVDGSKDSRYALSVMKNLISPPDEVVLLYVERLEGNSLMTEMLGEAELSTLKESLKGTDYKERLNRRTGNILAYCKDKLEELPAKVKTIKGEGSPAEEILRVADSEGAELIILGYKGWNRLERFIVGSFPKEVEKRAKVPVLIAKKPSIKESSVLKDAYYAISLSTAAVLFAFLLVTILEKIFLPYK